MICVCGHHRDWHKPDCGRCEPGAACPGFDQGPPVETTKQLRPVLVTAHALERALIRRHYAGDDVTKRELEQGMIAEVRAAFAAGRASTVLPRWARRFKERLRNGTEGQRYVWNADETLVWVVKREPREDVIVTSLQRVNSS